MPRAQVAKLVIVNRDITERKRAEQQLEHNLFHDPLTGLPNRRMFLDRLQSSFVRVAPRSGPALRPAPGQRGSLQSLQRNHGNGRRRSHPAGNCRRLAATFAAGRRPSHAATMRQVPMDVVLFRLGGDEFTVLLDAVGDPSNAMRVRRETFRSRGRALPGRRRARVRASMSIGIALSTHRTSGPKTY